MIKKILSLIICTVLCITAIPPVNIFASDTDCEHDYGDWSIETEASCTQEGKEIKICNLCGNTKTTVISAALGHSFGEWETVTEATCIKDGLEARVCSKCENEETRVTQAEHIFYNGECTGCGILLGDVNIDSNIDMLDLILIRNQLLDDTLVYTTLLDIDTNGEFDSADTTALRKMLFESF